MMKSWTFSPKNHEKELMSCIQKDSMLAITHKYSLAADEGEAKEQTVQGWEVVDGCKLSLAGGSSGHLLHNTHSTVRNNGLWS